MDGILSLSSLSWQNEPPHGSPFELSYLTDCNYTLSRGFHTRDWITVLIEYHPLINVLPSCSMWRLQFLYLLLLNPVLFPFLQEIKATRRAPPPSSTSVIMIIEAYNDSWWKGSGTLRGGVLSEWHLHPHASSLPPVSSSLRIIIVYLDRNCKERKVNVAPP